MNNPCRWLLLGLVTGCASFPAYGMQISIPASKPSHILIPMPSGRETLEELLARQLGRARDPSGLESLRAKTELLKLVTASQRYQLDLNTEDIDRLKRMLPGFNATPPTDREKQKLAELVAKVVEWRKQNNAAGGGTEMEQKQMQELAKVVKQRLEESSTESATGSAADTPPSENTSPVESAGGSPPGEGPEALSSPEESGKLLEGILRDYPNLLQGTLDIARGLLGRDNRPQAGTSRFGDLHRHLPRLGPVMGLDKLKASVNPSLWRKVSLPSVTGWQWPGRYVGSIHLDRAPAPRVNFPQSSSADVGAILFPPAAVLAAGFCLWHIYHRRPSAARSKAAAWKPGPWPVDPAAVSSREDLVRAFEHLALTQLGPEARAWNHRAIGARMNDHLDRSREEETKQSCRSAARLADLYELARYGRPDDPLSSTALAAARHDLCLLAGVAPG